MRKTIEIEGKQLEISTSKEADVILSSRKIPLIVEMELLFDAFVSKKVKFLAPHKLEGEQRQEEQATVSVSEKLSTRFRPVMLYCHASNNATNCEIEDFPIVKISPYVPKWLHIDFRFGHWFGEFGY